MRKLGTLLVLCLLLQLNCAGALAEDSKNLTEIAKQTQNPVANLISVPFEYYLYTQVGEDKQVANLLSIKPVIPFQLSDDWNLISRAMIPLEVIPTGNNSSVFGLGDINLSLFLTPKDCSEFIWGVGPAIQLPTSTSKYTGNSSWGLGPTAVGLSMDGPCVYGALFNAVWAINNSSACNTMLIQPFVNYNLAGGWALSFAPEITNVWAASAGNGWTLPLGFGVSKTFELDKQLYSASVAQYYDVISPPGGPNYYFKAELSLLFPK